MLDIHSKIERVESGADGHVGRLLQVLFRQVLDKLQELATVYRDELLYRSKYQTRKNRKERSMEVVAEEHMSHEFEDMHIDKQRPSKAFHNQYPGCITHCWLRNWPSDLGAGAMTACSDCFWMNATNPLFPFGEAKA